MPFSRRGNGLRSVFRHLRPKKIERTPISIYYNNRIRANSNDTPILRTNTQIKTLNFSSKRKIEVVEDRIDRSTGNLKMPCWLTGGCDD